MSPESHNNREKRERYGWKYSRKDKVHCDSFTKPRRPSCTRLIWLLSTEWLNRLHTGSFYQTVSAGGSVVLCLFIDRWCFSLWAEWAIMAVVSGFMIISLHSDELHTCGNQTKTILRNAWKQQRTLREIYSIRWSRKKSGEGRTQWLLKSSLPDSKVSFVSHGWCVCDFKSCLFLWVLCVV